MWKVSRVIRPEAGVVAKLAWQRSFRRMCTDVPGRRLKSLTAA
jgi:hypothetical protein